MSDIIKVKDKECFINSEDLAILSENEHRAVTKLIRTYKSDLEDFGVLTPVVSKPNSKGGRPKTTYDMNEEQATLLTTFMGNSKKVREFKSKLVREFFNMRTYIFKQETIRLAGKEVRKSLTDAVQESGEQERMHGHGYSQYTKMVYSMLGFTEMYEWWKGNAKEQFPKFRDWLKPEELKRVELAESLIKPLLELDKQYSEIKETLKPLFERKEIG
jgi:phage regulator Rha-like protein